MPTLFHLSPDNFRASCTLAPLPAALDNGGPPAILTSGRFRAIAPDQAKDWVQFCFEVFREEKNLILAYPNQKWEKEDITTTWNLSPGILCLLAEMVKDLVEVKIVNAQFYDLSVEDFKAEVREFGADYVGISVLTSEYEHTLDVTADAVKQVSPEIVVIAGGVHVTIEYERVMRNPNIDFAVRGEGEYVLQELLRYLNGDSDQLPEKGVVYRQDGSLKITPQALVDDLTALPWPDYSLVRMEDYLNTGARNGPLRAPEYPALRWLVTRGCPVGCSFCQVEFISGRKVRTRATRKTWSTSWLSSRSGTGSSPLSSRMTIFHSKGRSFSSSLN